MVDRIVVAQRTLNPQQNLVEMLRTAGFEVDEAGDGRQALQLVRSRDPDLLLADFSMTGMGGDALVQALQGDPLTAHIPTVLMIDGSDAGEASDGRNRRAKDYLNKPVSREDLLACIGSRIAKARSEQLTSRRLHDQAHRLSHYDGVTDLPNRTHFLLLLNDLLAGPQADRPEPLLWAVALDNMNEVAHMIGASQLDDWLYQMSQRLLEATAHRPLLQGPRSTVARLGDDRFAVLMPGWDPHSDLESAAAELLRLMQKPVLINDRELYPRIAIGVYPGGQEPASGETMVSRLELALALARARRPQRIGIYRPELAPEVAATFALHNDMHRAVERGEMRALFQPLVDARSNRIVACEALMRWEHPVQGLILPARFIPTAEDNGQIVRLGAWMLKQACEQASSWQAQVPNDTLAPKVSVNLSARQFGDPHLVKHIQDALQESGLSPQQLELEITEGTAMLDLHHTLELLRRFKSMGLGLAIDDFGTGYSSLAYLKRFPLDTLKIDQSFVRNICSDFEDQAIAGAVITLAHSLGLRVTAEGVESQDQHDLLLQMGCDTVQGYLHGRPMASDKIMDWLRAHWASP